MMRDQNEKRPGTKLNACVTTYRHHAEWRDMDVDRMAMDSIEKDRNTYWNVNDTFYAKFATPY